MNVSPPNQLQFVFTQSTYVITQNNLSNFPFAIASWPRPDWLQDHEHFLES